MVRAHDGIGGRGRALAGGRAGAVDIIVSHVCLPGVPGHILGASPRAQFGGQLLGTCASIFFSVAAWTLYSSM